VTATYCPRSMEREIAVRGRAEVSCLPDRAIIRTTVAADEEKRDDAFTAAAVLTRQVDEVIANRRAALGRVTTAALVVHPKTRWRKGESVRTGWRAARTSIVEVTAFDELGDLIAELISAGAALSGPTWTIDPDNPIHRTARRQAAEDARLRADDYAAALGLEIDDIAWVAEPGLRSGQDFGHPGRVYAAAAVAGGPHDDEIIDIIPEEITTAADVEVAFRVKNTPTATTHRE
jgi:uncharacterized protein YggE